MRSLNSESWSPGLADEVIYVRMWPNADIPDHSTDACF